MNTTPILRKTSPKLSTGKSKLLDRQRITSPIPMVDLTTDAALDVDPYKGVSPGSRLSNIFSTLFCIPFFYF